MTGRLRSNTREWDKLKRRLRRFDRRSIEVGFFSNKKYGPDNNNLQVAEVAMMNDYGTSKVPSRPFMTVDFVSYAEKTFPTKARQFFMLLILNPKSPFIKNMNELGEEFSFALQEIILDYPGRNSQWWADIKGFNDPLYHTGVMVESVSHRLKRGT
jgi:hypothetical protein